MAMAYSRPSFELGSTEWKVLYYANIAFSLIYALEAALKAFAYSFLIYIKVGLRMQAPV